MRSIVRVACLVLAGALSGTCGAPNQPPSTGLQTAAPQGTLPVPSPTASAEGQRSPDSMSDSACLVTPPNGSTPPGEAASPQNHGEGGMWTVLWPDGMVIVPTANVDDHGVLWMKFPWWRGRGVTGRLEVSGHEVSTGAVIESEIPDGYGVTGFQASGLGFSRPGCYTITAGAGVARLTVVTRVRLASGERDMPHWNALQVRVRR